MVHRLRVIDTHTAGEPTRIVLDGLPELGTGPVAARLERSREAYDHFRRAVVSEPRGAAHWVAAWVLEPEQKTSAAGVIFSNNVGYLGMCGHGLIGLVTALAWLGRIGPGRHRFETPVGGVEAELLPDGRVRLRNVPAYRYRARVPLQVPPWGTVYGDIAWGGNWFFLIENPPLPVRREYLEELTAFAHGVRRALELEGLRAANGAIIDHVQLLDSSPEPGRDGRNFVLCPGGQYDRSPCGTGTSALLACLYADGRLRPGQLWRQEGVFGSVFEGEIETTSDPERVIPIITGRAHVIAESVLVFDEEDPFCWGLQP